MRANAESEYGYTHQYFSNGDGVVTNWQSVTSQSGYPTVAIELATFRGKTVDWDNKWIVHIARKELHSIASVLLGFKASAEYSFHGAQKNVSYRIERRKEGGISLTIRSGGPGRSISIPADEVFWYCTMVVDAIIKNAPPGIPVNLIVPLIQRTQSKP